MALDKFERLEEGLLRLLASYETLAAEKEGFRGVVGAKDLEIAGLKEKLRKLEGERDQVREKVDGLLARLEALIQGA